MTALDLVAFVALVAVLTVVVFGLSYAVVRMLMAAGAAIARRRDRRRRAR